MLKLAEVFELKLEGKTGDLPATVEKLISERNEARDKKDYKKSDEIRKKLLALGVILEDTKEGTTWRRKV